MLEVSRASSGPCVRLARNSAHFSGVSAGSDVRDEDLHDLARRRRDRPASPGKCARAARSIVEAPAWTVERPRERRSCRNGDGRLLLGSGRGSRREKNEQPSEEGGNGAERHQALIAALA